MGLGFAACGPVDNDGVPEDAQWTERSQALSPVAVLQRESVQLVGRKQGPGKAAVGQKLKAKFSSPVQGVTLAQSNKTETTRRHEKTFGDGWKLKVSADGTYAEYRNYKYHEEKVKADPGTKMAKGHVTALARKFVEQHLADVVKLGRKEKLEPLGVTYEVEASQVQDKSLPVEERTVGSVALFTRAVDNVQVVGAGSKVAVLLTNQGDVYGFTVDWPELEFSDHNEKKQKVEKLASVQNRAERFSRVPARAEAKHTDRFECGYVDPGYKFRNPNAPMQVGCYNYYRGTLQETASDGTTGPVVKGFVDVVPAGTTVVADALWPEAQVLAGGTATPPEGEPAANPVFQQE
jgi:hypothetical protein